MLAPEGDEVDHLCSVVFLDLGEVVLDEVCEELNHHLQERLPEGVEVS